LFRVINDRNRPQRVCVLGVGTGTLAAYMKNDWELMLYEIDPAVERVALDDRYFTYISDARKRGAKVDITLGDGRLKIAEAPDGGYDMIFMDAFTSDAVPVHLMTKEAFEIYLKKLAPDGVIAVNISNRYLDFEPVMRNLAAKLNLTGRIGHGWEDKNVDMYGCSWVFLTRREDALGKLDDYVNDWVRWHKLKPEDDDIDKDAAVGVWTDDYSNLLKVFKWKR
jgi:hypothetical protein